MQQIYYTVISFILKPLWFLLWLFIPFFSTSWAYVQTYYYNVNRISIVNIENINYYDSIILNKSCIYLALLITVLMYFSFSLPMTLDYIFSKIKSTDKSKISIRRKTINNFFKYVNWKEIIIIFILSQTLGLIANKVINFKTEIDDVLLGNYIIPFLISLFIIFYLYISRTWVGGGQVGIVRVFLVLFTSSLVAFIIYISVHFYIPTELNNKIQAGLYKDLKLISIFFVLLSTFGIWVASRFSVEKGRVKKLSGFQYFIPLFLTLSFIVLGIYIWDQENKWLQLEFKSVSREIYSEEILNKIGLSKDDIVIKAEAKEKFELVYDSKYPKICSFHHDHLWWRSVYGLLIGLAISTAFATWIKVGAYYVKSKSYVEEK